MIARSGAFLIRPDPPRHQASRNIVVDKTLPRPVRSVLDDGVSRRLPVRLGWGRFPGRRHLGVQDAIAPISRTWRASSARFPLLPPVDEDGKTNARRVFSSDGS